jgi:hypothetical protein
MKTPELSEFGSVFSEKAPNSGAGIANTLANVPLNTARWQL